MAPTFRKLKAGAEAFDLYSKGGSVKTQKVNGFT
jgi:hypothetical protein